MTSLNLKPFYFFFLRGGGKEGKGRNKGSRKGRRRRMGRMRKRVIVVKSFDPEVEFMMNDPLSCTFSSKQIRERERV